MVQIPLRLKAQIANALGRAKQRRLVIGKATAIPLGRARQLAGELHAKVKLGRDPAADKAVSKARAANNFGDLARRDSPFSGRSKAKQQLDERITATTKKTLADWVPHYLRRTCATRMADLGVQPHVIEAVLNHVSGYKGGIAGFYNRALYAAEKAQALAIWADHITAVVEGRKRNVRPLKRA